MIEESGRLQVHNGKYENSKKFLTGRDNQNGGREEKRLLLDLKVLSYDKGKKTGNKRSNTQCRVRQWRSPPSAVILEPKKINSNSVSTASPSICHEVMGPDAIIFVF